MISFTSWTKLAAEINKSAMLCWWLAVTNLVILRDPKLLISLNFVTQVPDATKSSNSTSMAATFAMLPISQSWIMQRSSSAWNGREQSQLSQCPTNQWISWQNYQYITWKTNDETAEKLTNQSIDRCPVIHVSKRMTGNQLSNQSINQSIDRDILFFGKLGAM